MKKHQAKIGSILTGIRTSETGPLGYSDIIPLYAYAVRNITGSLPQDIRKRVTMANHCELSTDDMRCLYLELDDILCSLAPPYCYFGSNLNDNHDIGFWPDFDAALDDLPRFEDTSDVPKEFRGYFIHVSDHGNVTLYNKTSDKRTVEIWAVV
jgi:hypothetical protein